MKGVLPSPGSELPGYSQMSLTGHEARAEERVGDGMLVF